MGVCHGVPIFRSKLDLFAWLVHAVPRKLHSETMARFCADSQAAPGTWRLGVSLVMKHKWSHCHFSDLKPSMFFLFFFKVGLTLLSHSHLDFDHFFWAILLKHSHFGRPGITWKHLEPRYFIIGAAAWKSFNFHPAGLLLCSLAPRPAPLMSHPICCLLALEIYHKL